MGRRGRKRRLALEDQYWQLIRSGVGAAEACRRVGIGRKTGFRWRGERGGIVPVRLAAGERSERYLTLLDRHRIATLRAHGESMRAIARALGRAPSTLSRELRRNLSPHDRGVYDGDLAHACAARPRPGKLQIDGELRTIVAERLAMDWSPEQIAAWLCRAHPSRPDWHLCHETIYQGLYAPGISGLSRTLTTRLRVGDWEGDLIFGRKSRSASATLVDRHSRLVRHVHLPRGHGALELRDALKAAFETTATGKRRTLTWDQGPEMAAHDGIDELFDEGVYFAHPGAPWQRGSNENMNGLLRQYFPKGSDLSLHLAQALEAVAELLNHRLRKRLGWRTPAQAHEDAIVLHNG